MNNAFRGPVFVALLLGLLAGALITGSHGDTGAGPGIARVCPDHPVVPPASAPPGLSAKPLHHYHPVY